MDQWLDLNRLNIPRNGLGNTNNACESWFKTLLRVYLVRYSFSFPQVLKLILETVFPVSDSKFAHSLLQMDLVFTSGGIFLPGIAFFSKISSHFPSLLVLDSAYATSLIEASRFLKTVVSCHRSFSARRHTFFMG